MMSCSSSLPSGPFVGRSGSDANSMGCHATRSPASSPSQAPSSRRVKDFSWAPGGGVPNYPFGSTEERATRDRLHRTSLLFMELQQQVQDCLGRKRAHDARESAESLRIALAHPIKQPAPVVEPIFKRTRTGEYVAVFETAEEKAASVQEEQQQAATQHAAEEQETVTKKARIIAVSELPAPLKRDDLNAAYEQLPKGAEVAIEASIKMWREKRLDLSELMSTVKSFQHQSPVLKKALRSLLISAPSTPVECEVATPQEMRELSAMWGM